MFGSLVRLGAGTPIVHIYNLFVRRGFIARPSSWHQAQRRSFASCSRLRRTYAWTEIPSLRFHEILQAQSHPKLRERCVESEIISVLEDDFAQRMTLLVCVHCSTQALTKSRKCSMSVQRQSWPLSHSSHATCSSEQWTGPSAAPPGAAESSSPKLGAIQCGHGFFFTHPRIVRT